MRVKTTCSSKVSSSPACRLPQKRQPREDLRAANGVVMKRIIAVLLAVLMTLFATGCYRNTAHDGPGANYRGRSYSGFSRSRYDGVYDGFHYGYDGMLRDGARLHDGTRHGGMMQRGGGATHQRGGATHQGGGSTSQRGGTTHQGGGATQQGGGSTSQRSGTTHQSGGATQQGGGSTSQRSETTHQRNAMLRDGARSRTHQNTPPAVGGLEYVR